MGHSFYADSEKSQPKIKDSKQLSIHEMYYVERDLGRAPFRGARRDPSKNGNDAGEANGRWNMYKA